MEFSLDLSCLSSSTLWKSMLGCSLEVAKKIEDIWVKYQNINLLPPAGGWSLGYWALSPQGCWENHNIDELQEIEEVLNANLLSTKQRQAWSFLTLVWLSISFSLGSVTIKILTMEKSNIFTCRFASKHVKLKALYNVRFLLYNQAVIINSWSLIFSLAVIKT